MSTDRDRAIPPVLRRTTLQLLSAWLALGVAYISFLPPWEGFDETAHHSYLQQLVDTRQVPRRGASFLSEDVEEYARRAPLPYDAPLGRLTYRSFFEAPPDTVAVGRAAIQGRPASPRQYVPGSVPNWQQQHPPLAYVALAPVYLTTAHLSWAAHLWSLRVAAYLVAWLSLAIAAAACMAGARATTGADRDRWHWALIGVSIWPLCFPAWFPDMARLGNDAFSAALVSGIWLTTVRCRDRIVGMKPALTLGMLVGAGLLTKAFFIPVAAGLTAYICLDGGRHEPLGRRAAAVTVMLVTAGVIAGWWNLENWQQYYDLATSQRTGGLFNGLAQRFSVAAWLRGHAALVATVAWPGSWSLARPPYPFFVPLGVLVLLSAGAYAAALWRTTWPPVVRLPGWLLLAMLAVLLYYVWLRVAFIGEGRLAAGYYLHFLAGPLGSALGFGLWAWWGRPAFRRLFVGLAAYALAFAAAISCAQLLLFAGVLTKSAQKFYELAAPLPRPALLFGRLGVLAFPWLGLACWSIGATLLALGLLSARRFVADSPCQPHPRGL
jgi:hypothetical protein